MLGYQLKEYLSEDGKNPFKEWLTGLRDIRACARIEQRLIRASLGNLGDCSSVGEGVFELRVFYGPGYRVYFSLEHDNVMQLLYGGTKKTQWRDIQIAKKYLADFRKRQDGN